MRKTYLLPALLAILLLLAGCIGPQTPEEKAPIPSITASSNSTNVSEPVFFSAMNTVGHSDKNKYEWDFGDGTNATGPTVSHIYTKGGDYTVSLLVTNDLGKKGIAYGEIHINELPIPRIRFNLPIPVGVNVTFHAGDSTDSDGYIVDYLWNIDGVKHTGKDADHTFQDIGAHKITLTVTDNHGAVNGTTKTVTVVLREFHVGWDIESKTQTYTQSDFTEGDSKSIVEKSKTLNLTSVEFKLTWTDDIPFLRDPNDMFFMEVIAPNTLKKNITGQSGELVLIIGKLNVIPSDFDLRAMSEDDASRSLPLATDAGTGNWMVNVSLLNAPGFRDNDSGILDGGNDWELTITYNYYAPLITETDARD